MSRRAQNVTGWIFFLAAMTVLVLGCAYLAIWVAPIVIALGMIACAFWSKRDATRSVKVQPYVEPLNAKPKYGMNGVLKNPHQVQTQYEFRPTYLLNEDTGEIVETQVKHRVLPSFNADKPAGVHFE